MSIRFVLISREKFLTILEAAVRPALPLKLQGWLFRVERDFLADGIDESVLGYCVHAWRSVGLIGKHPDGDRGGMRCYVEGDSADASHDASRQGRGSWCHYSIVLRGAAIAAARTQLLALHR